MIREISVTQQGVQVSLNGGMYLDSAVEIREILTGYIENGHINFNIDLSGVDYMDSSGVGALLAVRRLAMKKGGRVTVKGQHGLIHDLFRLTQLDKVFES